jgi:hypothetical protein
MMASSNTARTTHALAARRNLRGGDNRRIRSNASACKKKSIAKESVKVFARDYPKPDKIDKTENYRIAGDLSNRFKVGVK